MDQHQPLQPSSIEPAPAFQLQPVKRKRAGAEAAGIGAVILALLAKLKTVLFFLAQFKWLLILGKFALTGGSLLLSIWAWALYFGWPFAAGFVILIFVHEMGHVIALRVRGIKSGWPVFIPLMGAFVNMHEMPRDAKTEAEVGIAGPLLGALGGFGAYLIGTYTHNQFWYALASLTFVVNLFNLIPVVPLDGGRVVAALSPKMWLVGIALLIGVFLLRPGPGLLFAGLLIALTIPRIVAAFRRDLAADPYYQIAPRDRALIAVQYFALAAFLAVMWTVAGHAVRVAG